MSRTTLQAAPEAMKHKPERPAKYTPNVTPLIDVMFLLLLFFLLGTTFRVDEGVLPGTLPNDVGHRDKPGVEPPSGLDVFVSPVGAANESALYEVKGRTDAMMDARQLYDCLASRAKSYDAQAISQTPLTIRARNDVRWEFVVEAWNQAARAKFQKITIQPRS